ncbi:MAG: hypothetical protein H7Z42_02860 [Roseiflexaceae bacterium]|nr:hypothetical protein [Roseiflexaceae bacterium]
MSLYLPTGTSPLINGALARIERRLPQPGEVLVRQGQRVEPEEIVARAYLPASPQVLNVARALSIPPASVERALKKEVGNKVAQGEIFARSSPLFGRTYSAPIAGIITAVDAETGYVTLTPDPVTYELQATVRGIVMEVLPGRGVRIETPAAQVYGVFGFGPDRSGVLHLVVTDPSEQIEADKITAKYAYSILIGGSGVSANALRRAVKEQVRGVIVGSIEAEELTTFLDWSSANGWRVGIGGWQMLAANPHVRHDITLVVTEGFGARPMSAALFEKLAAHDRQEALIEGTTRLRFPLTRPRVVIPLSARTPGLQLEPPQPRVRPGAQVRLLDGEHLGLVGMVRAVSAAPRRLSSRVRAHAVDVTLEDGSTILVPISAVEALT